MFTDKHKNSGIPKKLTQDYSEIHWKIMWEINWVEKLKNAVLSCLCHYNMQA